MERSQAKGNRQEFVSLTEAFSSQMLKVQLRWKVLAQFVIPDFAANWIAFLCYYWQSFNRLNMLFREIPIRSALMRPQATVSRIILVLLVIFLVRSAGFSAPSIITNFPGIGQTAYNPPDPTIAAGASNVIAMVNSTFTISTKSGSSVYNSSLANWFAPVSPPGTPFQPKIVYDPNGGHWIMLALASGNPRRSSYLVSVSSNSNPVGVWFLWNLDAGLDQSTASGNTADSPGLGYDDDAIYITSNQYDSHSNFQYAKLRI